MRLGQYLRDLCQDIATTFGGSSGPKLTCAAADAVLPIGTAVTLRLVADLLITNALIYAFPPGLAGWITVSFTAGPAAWQLVVEDSGIAMSADDKRDNGLTIARLLLLRHDGQLDIPSVTGGTRCIATIPRAVSRAGRSLGQSGANRLIEVSATRRPDRYSCLVEVLPLARQTASMSGCRVGFP